jgi:hypothetical protein
MDWSADAIYNKAKVYAQRAHDEPVESALFGFWMSLALELLARAALSEIHPVLLADPQDHENIYYAFGIEPKNPPKSIPAKALFSRCLTFIVGFTERMRIHCLIMADRRNSELHSGVAAFEEIDNSSWLPQTYEVMEILLVHLKRDFADFLGEHGTVAVESLKDRRDTIKREVQEKLAVARRAYDALDVAEKERRSAVTASAIDAWIKANKLRRKCKCPACGERAVMSGEIVGRTPARIDQDAGTISREIRVLPNQLNCASCKVALKSYQELREAGLGDIYTLGEEEDPIAFFGIEPEEYVDVEEIIRKYGEDMYAEYQNE